MFDSLFGNISSERIAVPQTAAAPGVELAAMIAVPEDPQGVVLFAHGLTGSKEDFVMAVPGVAEHGFAAVAWDHRGTYESDHRGPYTLPTFAADTAAVVAHWRERLALPVHLVGHSFGGLVAEAVAADDPDSLASLMLMCTGPGGMGETERIRVLCDMLESGQNLGEIFQRKLEIDNDGFPEFLVNFLRERFVGSDREAVRQMALDVMAAPDHTDRISGRLPAFVMYGEGDGSWPQPVQNVMAERLGTTAQVIPDAVHSPALENVDHTVQLIVENARACQVS